MQCKNIDSNSNPNFCAMYLWSTKMSQTWRNFMLIYISNPKKPMSKIETNIVKLMQLSMGIVWS